MSTDSQGRPLSDDGQWAWNGTEWVPAAGGSPAPAEGGAQPGEDVGATMIAPSPFAGGFPGGPGAPGAAAAPPAGAPGYGAAQPGYGGAQPAYGQAPQGYGQAPGYGAGVPGQPSGFGNPSQSKSRKPVILILVGLVVIAAIVVAIVLATSGGSSSSKASGTYNCTVVGATDHGTITFKSGNSYTVSGGSPGGTVTQSGSKLTFSSGSFSGATGVVSNGGKDVVVSIQGSTINCKK